MKNYYSSLLNPILGPAVRIERAWVKKAISKNGKSSKTAGLSGIIAEMLKASSGTSVDLVA